MPVDGDVVLKAGLDTTDISKKMDSMQKTISRGLKNIIRIGFGVRSVFTLMRKLRKSLFEGFGDLAQVYEPFNTAMSDIMTSLRLLRNSFAAAFAPIIETIAPALSTFINMMAEAVSKIGQFIAALTGKEYVQAATTYQDYAKSLDKSSKSSSKATKQTKDQTEAQKKLNREITHFDDLVILHEKHENENTTPTTTTTAPTTTLSSAPIGDAISQFAKDFKAAWAKADFTDIGRQIGEKLRDALNNINWARIKSRLAQIAHSIATFLNGFLETPGLFEAVGTTIGEAINSALVALDTFAWSFHWDSLGKAVSTTIVSALKTIDWGLVYHTVEGFAKGLADYLNALINPETFALIGQTLANVLNAALHYLATFGENFDWTNFGVSLATGLNNFLENLNIDEFKRGVHAFVYGIRNAIVSFLSETDWYKFGTTLRDLILAIPWTTILKSLGEVIWYAINAVIDIARGFFDTDKIGGPVANAFDTIKATLKDFKDNVDLDGLKQGFDNLIKVLEPIGEGFAVGFLNFFNSLFEIGSDFLSKLGPWMQKLADGLEKMDPDVLQGIGAALGIIAGALIVMKLATGVAGIVSALLSPLSSLASVAGNAASALGTGSLAAGGTGLVGSLFMAASGVGAFLFALDLFKENIRVDEEVTDVEGTFGTLAATITNAREELGLTSKEARMVGVALDSALNPAIGDASEQYASLDRYLQDSGVDMDTFRDGLKGIISESKNAHVVDALSGYIDSVGESSEEAQGNTSGLSLAFDAFDSLSLKTPLKMLLLSAAVKGLGDAGLLSDEQVGELQGTLDNYDPKHPETAINTVKTAFENAGIKADDFTASVALSMQEMPRETRTEVAKAVKTLTDAGDNFNKEAKKDAKQAGEGLKKGFEESEKSVNEAAGNMALVALLGIDTTFDSHSPSKEAKKRGGYVGDGLVLGINDSTSKVETAVKNLASKTISAFDNFKTRFSATGREYMSNLYSGISNGGSSLYTLARNTANNIYDSFDLQGWRTLGQNIGIGIYNGLVSEAGWLETLAWNTAVRMYNAACDALDVGSPSRKFAWIGEMLMKGWENGIVDNSDSAVGAVADIAGAMTDEAEDMNPAVTISTSIDNWIDALDSVLTDFSETVINRFDNLVETLAQLGSVSTMMPAVAQGRVIPSSIASAANASANSSEMKALLDSLASQQISYDDLRGMLIEMFTDYMQTSFYLGDEQIARHANNGNLLLNRRYSIIK